MFSQRHDYAYDLIPGHLSVPYDFKVLELKDYVFKNMDQCRLLATKYINN
jgi:hypothetical protein